MKISFQKQKGKPALGLSFFWQLKIEVDTPTIIADNFIPELFYDYIFVQQGAVRVSDTRQGLEFPLSQQTFKTIHTHHLTFNYTAPLTLLGARLSLGFAEAYWDNIMANAFVACNWVGDCVADLSHFASQITATIKTRQAKKVAGPMFSPSGTESDWLTHFSPRHKRRLYKAVFGISKKEIQAIQGVHTFLGQTCDFSSQNPRIIEYIDSERFYDQPHLNHAFKKMTGLSPLAYFQASSILQDNLMAASYNEIAE